MANQIYYIVELNMDNITNAKGDIIEWLTSTLGPKENGRWFVRFPQIYFCDKKDHMMFLLRWS